MADDTYNTRELPIPDQPLNGPPRSLVPALLGLLVVVLVVVGVFALVTLIRYNP